MSDFERELDAELARRWQADVDRKNSASRERQAQEFEAARKEQLEQDRIRRRKSQIDRLVLPIQGMVERNLLALGSRIWGVGKCGVELERYDKYNIYDGTRNNAIARLEIGRDQYSHFRKYGAFIFRKPPGAFWSQIGEYQNYWIPIDQAPRGEDRFERRSFYGVTLIANDGYTPFFAIVREESDCHISARTWSTSESELRSLLLKEFKEEPSSERRYGKRHGPWIPQPPKLPIGGGYSRGG